MKKKWLMLSLTVGVIVLAAGFFHRLTADPLRAPARKQWKAAAISQIEQRVRNSNWLEAELQKVRQPSSQDSLEWFSENLILTKSGDWIVFESKCSKEPGKIRDIFIGRASNGKWYYSTFHFCVRMLVLKSEEQPGSLSEFAGTYFLREFDGQSDDCLRQTWPPGS